MMLLKSLLILISLAGYFCDDERENCIVMQKRECDLDLMPKEFPETVEGLMTGCRDLQTVINCVLEVRKSCNEDDPYIASTSDVQKYADYLKLVCEEDNPTFKAISSNFDCVKRVYESKIKPCGYDILTAESVDVLEEHINPLLALERSDLSSCLFGLLHLTCESIAYDVQCGQDVGRAVEDIVMNMGIGSIDEFECTPEHLEELKTFNTVLEAVLIEELTLENAIKRKRK